MPKIICICNGDSSNISTWSNVPYLLTQELINLGYTLHRVNIAPPRLWQRIYNITAQKVLTTFYPGHEYGLIRTQLYLLWANRLIKKAIQENSDADLCLFFTFSFKNPYNDVPSILLCDWSFETLIRNHKKREPYWFEQKYIKKEQKVIAAAQYIVSLFPQCAEAIQRQIPSARLITPGKLPINNIENAPIIPDELIVSKQKKISILFIGRGKYKEACSMLIDAVTMLNTNGNKEYELHIVGLTPKDISKDIDTKHVHCYGFLHKNIAKERALYYRLIKQATVFANPSPEWGGYSSMTEAMLYCTPILVAAYPEFTAEFGSEINFGRYSQFTIENIADSIESIISSPHYATMAMNAHMAVKDRSWNKFVRELLHKINNENFNHNHKL